MCGIAGLIGQGWTRLQLNDMVDVQSHRGPDDTGIFIDDSRMALTAPLETAGGNGDIDCFAAGLGELKVRDQAPQSLGGG